MYTCGHGDGDGDSALSRIQLPQNSNKAHGSTRVNVLCPFSGGQRLYKTLHSSTREVAVVQHTDSDTEIH